MLYPTELREQGPQCTWDHRRRTAGQLIGSTIIEAVPAGQFGELMVIR